MQFEDFIEGLLAINRKLARASVKDSSEAQYMLLANEDILYNWFLKEVMQLINEENKYLEVMRRFECQAIQVFIHKT